ncbi:MAG: ubiquinone/menaquinone biosynthesis C-methylase UbiE [Arcticibacterium sp.]|jgi:ubiquinone/menaquinone biosynthesis C-methylase UbiE
MAFIPALKYHFLTRYYDRFIGFWMPEKEVKRKAISLAKIDEGDLVLDFGCGTGVLMELFEEELLSSRIIGLDVDSEILAIAKAKGIAKVNLVLFNGTHIPFPDLHFDKVISTWVFHHLSREEKLRALKEIRRVLKPNGSFILVDWGRAANILMRILFFVLQVVDNFRTTSDNIQGQIPKLLKTSKFSFISELGHRNTFFGTLRFWHIKP